MLSAPRVLPLVALLCEEEEEEEKGEGGGGIPSSLACLTSNHMVVILASFCNTRPLYLQTHTCHNER